MVQVKKNVKNTHIRVFLLVKLQASDKACNLTKRNTNSKCFQLFKSCTNGTKTGKATHILKEILAKVNRNVRQKKEFYLIILFIEGSVFLKNHFCGNFVLNITFSTKRSWLLHLSNWKT